MSATEIHYRLSEVQQIFEKKPFEIKLTSFYKYHRKKIPFVHVPGMGHVITRSQLNSYISEQMHLPKAQIN